MKLSSDQVLVLDLVKQVSSDGECWRLGGLEHLHRTRVAMIGRSEPGQVVLGTELGQVLHAAHHALGQGGVDVLERVLTGTEWH